jgi:hypothetical protein
MTNGKDITPLSITDGKISNQAKIKPAKLAPGAEAQVLIAQSDGKFAPKTISGDARLRANGLIELTNKALAAAKVTEADLNAAGGITESDFGKETVLVSNQQGRPEQKTADEFREFLEVERGAAKNQSTISADIITNGVAETTTDSGTSNSTTTQTTQKKVITFDVPSDSGSYSAGAPGTSTSNYPVEFTHNCGYIPDISVYYKSNNAQESDPWEEIDAEVTNTTTTTKVQISAQNARLKIVAS